MDLFNIKNNAHSVSLSWQVMQEEVIFMHWCKKSENEWKTFLQNNIVYNQ